jgi:hypothetical protein
MLKIHLRRLLARGETCIQMCLLATWRRITLMAVITTHSVIAAIALSLWVVLALGGLHIGTHAIWKSLTARRLERISMCR